MGKMREERSRKPEDSKLFPSTYLSVVQCTLLLRGKSGTNGKLVSGACRLPANHFLPAAGPRKSSDCVDVSQLSTLYKDRISIHDHQFNMFRSLR